MKTSRILCSACFNPPKDRLLKSFCSAHPRFLVCNECWDSQKGTQCLQCRKGKILQDGKSKQQIDKSPPNYDGNSIGYNAYHLSKGGIDQLYLTQLETEKNLAYAELMNKELEYKQLKEKFDQMVNKLEEHKKSTLYQLKQQQQMQMEGYQQKLQREYLEKEEVRKREIEEQRASLRRQQQQLHNEQRIRQQLSKIQNEKQINRLIIEMTEQRAKFKEEEIRWNMQIYNIEQIKIIQAFNK